MELITKKYQHRDMFFNNGLVNLYRFLQEKDFELETRLENSFLILTIDSKKADEIYFEILNGFLKEYKIVHQTKKGL